MARNCNRDPRRIPVEFLKTRSRFSWMPETGSLHLIWHKLFIWAKAAGAVDGCDSGHRPAWVCDDRSVSFYCGDWRSDPGSDCPPGGGGGFACRAESAACPGNCVVGGDAGGCAAVPGRQVYGVVAAGGHVPALAESRAVHLFFGGLVLPQGSADAADREIHPRAGNGGGTAGGRKDSALASQPC